MSELTPREIAEQIVAGRKCWDVHGEQLASAYLAQQPVIDAARELIVALTGKPWRMVPSEADELAAALRALDQEKP